MRGRPSILFALVLGEAICKDWLGSGDIARAGDGSGNLAPRKMENSSPAGRKDRHVSAAKG